MFYDIMFKKHEKLLNEFLALTFIVCLLNMLCAYFGFLIYPEFIFIALTLLQGIRILYIAYKDKQSVKIEMYVSKHKYNCPCYKGPSCEGCNTHNEYCFKCENYLACEDCENNNRCTKCIKDVYMNKLIEDKMRSDR